MINTTRSAPLQALTEAECLTLLATSQVGRLAITQHALPALIPVRLRLAGDHVVIESLIGMAVPLATQSVAALETGNLGEGLGREWSVEVCGLLQRDSSSKVGDDEGETHETFRLSTTILRGWCARS
jgi:Pyridoxamine 5'-phosphate oxidase